MRTFAIVRGVVSNAVQNACAKCGSLTCPHHPAAKKQQLAFVQSRPPDPGEPFEAPQIQSGACNQFGVPDPGEPHALPEWMTRPRLPSKYGGNYAPDPPAMFNEEQL